MRHLLLSLIALLFSLPASAEGLSAPDALAGSKAGTLTIIDVRTPAEWRQTGIAPGARTADFANAASPDAFVAEVLKLTGGNKAAPLVVICRSGNRSAKAVAVLSRAGFTNLRDIGEGMNGWVARGLPVVPAP